MVDRDIEGLAELRTCETVQRMIVVTDGAQNRQFAFCIKGLLDGDAAHEFLRLIGTDFLCAVFRYFKSEVEINIAKIGDEICICFFSS